MSPYTLVPDRNGEIQLNSAPEWRAYFEDLGIREDLINLYEPYAKSLLDRGVPVIFNRPHLAALLGRTDRYLRSVAFGSDHHYREFRIKKRTGGTRQISAPYPMLLECQRWIAQHVLAKESMHPAASGYIRGKSIVDNASPHVGAPVVLKMDLTDFFPSIGLRRVINVFRSLGYSPEVSYLLGRVCVLRGCLPQGAATSPALSNIIARRLDGRLAGLASKYKLAYTRYADDMTFSGPSISHRFSSIVEKIIQEEGFRSNEKKTKLMNGTGRRLVTGLSVNSELRVPRPFRRLIRQEIYYIQEYGYRSHVRRLRKSAAPYFYSLRGRANFWSWIEGQSHEAKDAIEKLKAIKSKISMY